MMVVNTTDFAFALDSVPAIFGITQDAFIVFTSNIFAILGLRALYFLLAGAMDMFRYLQYGLSAILVFVGLKMIGQHWIEEKFLNHQPIPHWVSLLVIVGILTVAIGASLIAARREGKSLSLDDVEPEPKRIPPPHENGDHGAAESASEIVQGKAVD
jgi:tellurite resistance protein TerC